MEQNRLVDEGATAEQRHQPLARREHLSCDLCVVSFVRIQQAEVAETPEDDDPDERHPAGGAASSTGEVVKSTIRCHERAALHRCYKRAIRECAEGVGAARVGGIFRRGGAAMKERVPRMGFTTYRRGTLAT